MCKGYVWVKQIMKSLLGGPEKDQLLYLKKFQNKAKKLQIVLKLVGISQVLLVVGSPVRYFLFFFVFYVTRLLQVWIGSPTLVDIVKA